MYVKKLIDQTGVLPRTDKAKCLYRLKIEYNYVLLDSRACSTELEFCFGVTYVFYSPSG